MKIVEGKNKNCRAVKMREKLRRERAKKREGSEREGRVTPLFQKREAERIKDRGEKKAKGEREAKKVAAPPKKASKNLEKRREAIKGRRERKRRKQKRPHKKRCREKRDGACSQSMQGFMKYSSSLCEIEWNEKCMMKRLIIQQVPDDVLKWRTLITTQSTTWTHYIDFAVIYDVWKIWLWYERRCIKNCWQFHQPDFVPPTLQHFLIK